MSVDLQRLAELEAAIADYEGATKAWMKRAALEHYGSVAKPDLVDALVDEYRANAPTNADLDDVAAVLRNLATELESFGTKVPVTAGFAVIAITGNYIRRTGTMAFTLQTGQQVDLSASYQDAHGNTATVESQSWTSSDETIVDVTDNGDGTATAASTGTTGTAQVTLTADARFGPDVVEIIGVLDIDVVSAEAVTATITPGTPTDIGGTEPTPAPEG